MSADRSPVEQAVATIGLIANLAHECSQLSLLPVSWTVLDLTSYERTPEVRVQLHTQAEVDTFTTRWGLPIYEYPSDVGLYTVEGQIDVAGQPVILSAYCQAGAQS